MKMHSTKERKCFKKTSLPDYNKGLLLVDRLYGPAEAERKDLLGGITEQDTNNLINSQNDFNSLNQYTVNKLQERYRLNNSSQHSLTVGSPVYGDWSRSKLGPPAVQGNMCSLVTLPPAPFGLPPVSPMTYSLYLQGMLSYPSTGMMSHAEIQQLWKEVATQSGLEDNAVKNNLNGLTIPSVPVAAAAAAAATQVPILPTPSFTNGGPPIDGLLFPGE